MKRFRIRFTPEASRLISKLHPETKKMIKSALDGLKATPYAGSPLQGELSGFRSMKIKRYRVLYCVNEEEAYIEVLYVGHRRDVYEQFRVLLSKLR
ncbi:MAG: type II toxin-antitoxin system RelE/ParE family toxin [Deltaproteobacteria bacterium]|nr:type II toxin-antitoxin system RelE/ParE family toxin [Deltaproteobacteria bacterium]MBW1930756.1 type II toxin-antitoxin system RelE/ParE family toxin [Deltaproteobacteria bacterium]MBW2023586.1 type II toxin-antitoxin system RelE/ParE family toxin [Deltaproteobacteria bacterium]